MTSRPKRPTGPPPSAGVLARHAQAYARGLGVAEGRVVGQVTSDLELPLRRLADVDGGAGGSGSLNETSENVEKWSVVIRI